MTFWKPITVGALSALALSLAACGGGDGESSASSIASPDSIEFVKSDAVDTDPTSTTESCSSQVVEIDGVAYTFKGAEWDAGTDSSNLWFNIAPEPPANSTIETITGFDMTRAIQSTIRPGDYGLGSEYWFSVNGERQRNHGLVGVSRLQSVGVTVPTALSGDIGLPDSATVTVDGHSLGSCTF